MKQIGLVAIGRNEGQRLRQCLVSATDKVVRVVYVDSGSTDGSLELARSALLDLWCKLYFTAQNFGNRIAEILTLRYISYINHPIARRAIIA
ncbi:glycosyltransferase [Microcoleus sp. B4-D4]|uniref:glycosyltransferase n=1 Tax=Microcoleus sp. B4-D4 TaxID=2818667 RepID=UPI002FD1B40E